MSTIHAAGATINAGALTNVGDITAVNAPGGTVTINAATVNGVTTSDTNNLTIDGGGTSLTTLSLKAGTVKAGFDVHGGAAFTVDPIQTVTGSGMDSGAIVTIGRQGPRMEGVKGLLQFKSLYHDGYFKFANDDTSGDARLKLAYAGSVAGGGLYRDLLTITATDGLIGIGTTRPFCALTVNAGRTVAHNELGGNQPYLNGYHAYTLTGHDGDNSRNSRFYDSASAYLGIWSYGHIMSYYGFIWGSDKRIKNDIIEVNDGRALDIVNKLECKEYNYTDPLRRKEMKTIGFIAQEVKEVLPNAVSITISHIPDELRVIENPKWSQDGNKHILTIDDLELSDSHTGNCKFYVSNEPDGKGEIMKEVDVNDDKKSFTFDQKYEKVFLHGKQVNDFHTIDKTQIFALHHSAIQELSRKHDACLLLLEQENSQLRSRLDSLEAAVAALQK